MYENLSQEEYGKLAQRCVRIVFPNGDTDFSKCLWRLCRGNRQQAFYVIKVTLWHYHIEIDDTLFDHICAEGADGFEIEWESYQWEEPTDDIGKYRREKQIEELQEIDDFFKKKNSSIT